MAANGTSFRKGASGNPAGRAQGSRNRATVDLEALLDGEGEAIVRKAVELAKLGDPVALRLMLDRIVAPRRERRLAIDLPEIRTPADAVVAAGQIVQAVGKGQITLSEAADLSRLVESAAKTAETAEVVASVAERLARLEAQQEGKR